jgi:hypothetical protein
MAKKKLTLWAAALALALPMLFAGNALAIYAGDGTKPNGATGGWDITDYGQCIAGIKADGTMIVDTNHNKSRSDCIDHTYVGSDYNSSANCTKTSGRSNGDDLSHYWTNTCIDGSGNGINMDGLDRTATNCALKGGTWTSACIGSWVYTGSGTSDNPVLGNGDPGFCYTTIVTGSTATPVDGGYNTAGTCPTGTPGFTASGSGATYKCTYSYGVAGIVNANLSYKDGSGVSVPINTYTDLRFVTQGQCLFGGGSWSTGTIKSGVTTLGTTTISRLATVTNTRAGCLECHNSASQNNQYAERWKEPYMKTGHKNMLRKVTAGSIWAGPDGVNYEATGWANGSLNFTTATASATAGTTLFTDKPLMYIFGDWMAAAPAGLDVIVAMETSTAKYNGASTYSCAPCHTTGWSNPTAGICVVGSVAKSAANEAACTALGGTWTAMNGVQGAAAFDKATEPGASFPAMAQANGTINGITGKWDRDGIMCSRCHATTFPAVMQPTYTTQAACETAGFYWSSSAGCSETGTHNNTPSSTRNQLVTQICFGCHQSIGKVANNTGADTDLGNPALNIPATATDFTSHPITNQFLNSPHAQYTVTSGNGIAPNSLGKYSLVGNAASQYASAFKGSLCRSSTTAGGGSILAEVWKNGANARIASLEDCNLANGKGTASAPDSTSYGYWQTENQGSCTTCHDVHQSLFDPAAEEPLKRECDTCHHIDMSKTNHPTGFNTPWDKTKHVNACEVCHMPKATDAGFPIHLWRISTDVNYKTFPDGVTKKNANVDADGKIWIDVDIACGQCHGGSKGAGATKDGAFYRSKSQLATWASSFHNGGQDDGGGVQPTVGKGAVTTNLYTVSFTDASTTGATISVNWGDGNVDTGNAGETFTHTYTRAKSFTILHIASNQQLFANEKFTVAVPQKFSVSGTVTAGTTLSLRKNGRTVKALKASQTAGGTFDFGQVIPGNYTITAYKKGVAFANPYGVDATAADVVLALP